MPTINGKNACSAMKLFPMRRIARVIVPSFTPCLLNKNHSFLIKEIKSTKHNHTIFIRSKLIHVT